MKIGNNLDTCFVVVVLIFVGVADSSLVLSLRLSQLKALLLFCFRRVCK